jgi:hypothetical protein
VIDNVNNIVSEPSDRIAHQTEILGQLAADLAKASPEEISAGPAEKTSERVEAISLTSWPKSTREEATSSRDMFSLFF